jgi:hypothetical protein
MGDLQCHENRDLGRLSTQLAWIPASSAESYRSPSEVAARISLKKSLVNEIREFPEDQERPKPIREE